MADESQQWRESKYQECNKQVSGGLPSTQEILLFFYSNFKNKKSDGFISVGSSRMDSVNGLA